MKKIILFLLIFIDAMNCFSQEGCKIETLKSPVGNKSINGIMFSVNQGKCIISKSDSTITLTYKTSVGASILLGTTIDVNMDLETAEFNFQGDSTIKTKVRGYASAENREVLKPQLHSPTFSVVLNKTLIDMFMTKLDISANLTAERGAVGFMWFTKKDVLKIRKALACM